MRSRSSLSRRGVLLIVIISPALLGSEWKCTAVSNPTVATARIEHLEPRMPWVGDIVNVTGSGTGTPPLQFAWNFGDGTPGAGMQTAHVYKAPGTYHVTLTVRDAGGNTGSDSLQVVVAARQSSQALSVVPLSDPVAGQPVMFVALPFEEDIGELNYVWTFSDGQSAIGPQAVATFQMPGMYLASVTTTNRSGATAVAQITFHVMDAAL